MTVFVVIGLICSIEFSSWIAPWTVTQTSFGVRSLHLFLPSFSTVKRKNWVPPLKTRHSLACGALPDKTQPVMDTQD